MPPRAGTAKEYYDSDEIASLDAYAWFGANSEKEAHAVGQKKPNRFGLYDMHGNVWEWTLDCWNPSYVGAPADGAAQTTGDCSRRVIRSGSWYYFPEMARSAERRGESMHIHSYNIGLRVVQEIEK